MKAIASICLIACLGSAPLISAADGVRTAATIPGLPLRVLHRTVCPTIYQHLIVSPVEAWVAVRAELSQTHLYGARVIYSEDNGAYDKYALQLAKDWKIDGHFGLGKLTTSTPVVIYVLIYEIADGTMALSFPVFEEAGGDQLEYYGGAKLAVQQSDGGWADLKLPEGQLGKNHWAVRAGVSNDFALSLKLEGHPH